MGVSNFPNASNFVERDSYLPEGWSKQRCSDAEGNGYISYISPNGDTFRSRKAVDEYLANSDEPAGSALEENRQFDQPKEVKNVAVIKTDVEDNVISKSKLNSTFEFDSSDEDDEVDDNQCNICGNIFDEDKDLILHVENVHKDYYFDEDNSLLLKESLVSKVNSVSKCKLCLENFKNEDLEPHMKGLHPSDYQETESNVIYGGREQNDGTKETVKNDEKQEINSETDKFEGIDEKLRLETSYGSIDEDDEDVDDNQCNICGKTFEEDKNLILHIEDIHKDYYFDEDNSLLLKEDFIAKGNSVSKCQLCLENFKNEDLYLHMKGMHPDDYEETPSNSVRNIEQADGKQSVLGKDIVYKPNQTQNGKLVNNIIINDDENEKFTERKTSQNHTSTDAPLKPFSVQAPLKIEPKLEPRPSNIETTSAKNQTSGREAPYICNLCDIKYYVRSHLQVHNERMHKKCKWKCDVCLTVHANEAELKEHNATSQHEYKTRTLMVNQIPQQPGYQPDQNAQSLYNRQPNPNAYSTFNRQPYQNAQLFLNQQPNQRVQSLVNRQPNQNSQFLSNRQPNQNVQPLSNLQPDQNSEYLPNRQTIQNGQSRLNKPPIQNGQSPSNKRQKLNPPYISNQDRAAHQLKGVPPLDSNKYNPQESFERGAQVDPTKWNPQGDISQLTNNKWTHQGSLATQINKEYNPPQYIPQPRSKTYEPQDIKSDIKPILSQPQEVKPAPPPSPPRPMDPVTKMHLDKVSLICRDLNLFDYPVPVNPTAKQIFKDPHPFGAYLLPLLMSVNPTAKMQDLATLGKAKWAQLLESQTGAMEPPPASDGTASVVNTTALVVHMQHLQIIQSMDAQ